MTTGENQNNRQLQQNNSRDNISSNVQRTKERESGNLELATLGQRIVAHIIDFFVAVIGGFIITMIAVTGFGISSGSDGSPIAMGIGFLFVLFPLIYFTLLEGIWGTTIGKKALSLRVAKMNGSDIGLGTSIGRNITRLLFWGTLPKLVTVLVIASSDKNQRIGDQFVNTSVFKSN